MRSPPGIRVGIEEIHPVDPQIFFGIFGFGLDREKMLALGIIIEILVTQDIARGPGQKMFVQIHLYAFVSVSIYPLRN